MLTDEFSQDASLRGQHGRISELSIIVTTRAMSRISALKGLVQRIGRKSVGGGRAGNQSFKAYTTFRQPNASLPQLQMFPEYTAAIEHESVGDYAKAIPLYQRFHEVISSAMGSGSSLAIELTYNGALLQKQSGNYDRAIQTINASIKSATTKVDQVRLHELLAVCHLLKGEFEKAVEIATRTVDICEAHEEHNSGDVDDADELALFSPSYSILGKLTFCLVFRIAFIVSQNRDARLSPFPLFNVKFSFLSVLLTHHDHKIFIVSISQV